jgi:hypothetical protein
MVYSSRVFYLIFAGKDAGRRGDATLLEKFHFPFIKLVLL